MKTDKRTKFFCVSGKTPEEFQQNMQKVLDHVADPILHFPPVPLMGYIYYTEERHVPETLREVMREKGEMYTCVQCPYFDRTNDLRKKWHYCVFHEQKCNMEADICDEILMQVATGKIEMKGGR